MANDTIYLNGLGMEAFTNTSVNSDAWLWNFGDGATSNEQDPTHVYAAVTLTSYNNNCNATTTHTVIVIASAAGITENQAPDYNVIVYPNPNEGRFILKIENCLGCLEHIELVAITNILGEVVFSQTNIKTSTIDIDLSSHSKGIYFVKMVLPATQLSNGSSAQSYNDSQRVVMKKIVIN